MPKPELVLSNATSFWRGNFAKTFADARRYGFKYVEIFPYRWTKVKEILTLEKRYNVQVAGIHPPDWWQTPLKLLRQEPKILRKVSTLIIHFYSGNSDSSPAWQIAEALNYRRPYFVIHTDVMMEMKEKFAEAANRFNVVIENIPKKPGFPQFYWDPTATKNELAKRGFTAKLLFDPGHFEETRQHLPDLDLLAIYQAALPEIIHISYNNSPLLHTLPNAREQQELKELLKIHAPQYITLETNPLVSVKKGKLLLDRIIKESQIACRCESAQGGA